jgi:hypothetical protein
MGPARAPIGSRLLAEALKADAAEGVRGRAGWTKYVDDGLDPELESANGCLSTT